jgi:hypothetical protein
LSEPFSYVSWNNLCGISSFAALQNYERAQESKGS